MSHSPLSSLYKHSKKSLLKGIAQILLGIDRLYFCFNYLLLFFVFLRLTGLLSCNEFLDVGKNPRETDIHAFNNVRKLYVV